MTIPFDAAAADIVHAGRFLDAKGYAPGGGGNYSVRLADGSFAITVSGRHKGHLTIDDVMRVDAQGRSLDAKKPSAETLLHMLVYRLFPAARVVLHTHGVASVVLMRARAGMSAITLSDYELLKAFPGVQTHAVEITLPVFENDQDMMRLAGEIEPVLAALRPPGFLLRGHGLYVWAGDMAAALGAAEAGEYLLACEWEFQKRPNGDIR